MIRLISPGPAAAVAPLSLLRAAGPPGVAADNLDGGAWSSARARGGRAAGLVEHLQGVILGQEATLRAVSLAIWAAEAGFTPPSPRPRAVFLSFGPTGVGKTETPRQVARFLFGGEPAHLALNQFGDANSAPRFQEALAARVRAGDHCGRVLILDEVDKPSRDTTDVLLSVLDEGRLQLPDGGSVDFSPFYIFLCSNVGSDRLHAMDGHDDAAVETMRSFVFAEAARTMRPELFARATRQLFYRPLTDRVQREIVRARLADKLAWVSQCLGNCPIHVHGSTYDAIVGLGFHDQRQGARRVRNLVEEMVDAALAQACADPVPPTPPLELRARLHSRGEGEELEFFSPAARVSALPGAAFGPTPFNPDR